MPPTRIFHSFHMKGGDVVTKYSVWQLLVVGEMVDNQITERQWHREIVGDNSLICLWLCAIGLENLSVCNYSYY